MEFFSEIFHIFLKEPLLNALVALYEYIPGQDFGIAVIALTLLIRFAFYPLSAQASRAQKKLTDLQPKIKQLQEQYKENREKQAKALWELYRQEKINPFSSILPILIQLPVLITLYHLFWSGFGSEELQSLYSFMPQPESIDSTFLGWVDLSSKNFGMALLAGVAQFLQLKQTMGQKEQKEAQKEAQKPKESKKKKDKGKPEQPDFATMFRKQMLYIFPVAIVVITSQLPSAVGLYLIVTSLFSVWQYWFVNRENNAPKEVAVSAES